MTLKDTGAPRWQKPVGMLAILALIATWCIGIVSLSPWIGEWHPLIQLAFYLAAGIAWLWILPMRQMLSWMETGRWRSISESKEDQSSQN